ncbi:hypothetical protein BGX28_005840 [Mortierella sp. GBA30]|nr:hypothetical protein BGX28_005840 [Mortierella sp. GBA30]
MLPRLYHLTAFLLALSGKELATVNAQQSQEQSRLTYNDCKPVEFKNMVVFGDSFSDNGNVYRLSQGSWPRKAFYTSGRFTNGLVWADYVAKDKRLKLTNFAFGGATTDSETVQGYTGSKSDIPVPGFIQQIEDYYLPNRSPTDMQELDSTVFTVNFQGNDYLFDPKIGTEKVLANIERGIHRLVDVGARHIFVVENLDIGLIPAFRSNQTLSEAYSALSRKQYREYQAMRKRLAEEYGYPVRGKQSTPFYNCKGVRASRHERPETRVNVAFFDLYTFERKLVQPRSLERLGITDVIHGCVSGDYQSMCRNPRQHFYFDAYHMVTTVHREIANTILYSL